MRLTVGDIKTRRRALGLTQAQAAAALRVPVRTWENWEGGVSAPPGIAGRALDLLTTCTAVLGAMQAQPQVTKAFYAEEMAALEETLYKED